MANARIPSIVVAIRAQHMTEDFDYEKERNPGNGNISSETVAMDELYKMADRTSFLEYEKFSHKFSKEILDKYPEVSDVYIPYFIYKSDCELVEAFRNNKPVTWVYDQLCMSAISDRVSECLSGLDIKKDTDPDYEYKIFNFMYYKKKPFDITKTNIPVTTILRCIPFWSVRQSKFDKASLIVAEAILTELGTSQEDIDKFVKVNEGIPEVKPNGNNV
jgi:hypothetical protein